MSTGSPKAPSPSDKEMYAEIITLQNLPDIVLESILAKVDGRSLRSVMQTDNKRLNYFARCRYNQICWQVLNSWSKWYRPAVQSKSIEMLQSIDKNYKYVQLVERLGHRVDFSLDKCVENLYLQFAPIAITFGDRVTNVNEWMEHLVHICSEPAIGSIRLGEYMNVILGLLGYMAEVTFAPPLTTIPARSPGMSALDDVDEDASDGRRFDLPQLTDALNNPKHLAVIDEWIQLHRLPDFHITGWLREMYVNTCLMQTAVAQCESLCVHYNGNRWLFTHMLPMCVRLRRLWVHHLGETELPWLVEYLQRSQCRVVELTLHARNPELVRHYQPSREWMRLPQIRVQAVVASEGDQRIERRMKRVRFLDYEQSTDRMLGMMKTSFVHWPVFEFDKTEWITEWIARMEQDSLHLIQHEPSTRSVWLWQKLIRRLWLWLRRFRY